MLITVSLCQRPEFVYSRGLSSKQKVVLKFDLNFIRFLLWSFRQFSETNSFSCLPTQKLKVYKPNQKQERQR